MLVHVFGNKPSPVIENNALQKTADIASETYGNDVMKFVQTSMKMIPPYLCSIYM